MHFLSFFVALAVASIASSQKVYQDYVQTFGNLTNAIQSLSDYMSWRNVSALDGCLEACDNDPNGCTFVNFYNETTYYNDGESPTPRGFGCSLYKECHCTFEATNPGQVQPNGTEARITASEGWCKIPPNR